MKKLQDFIPKTISESEVIALITRFDSKYIREDILLFYDLLFDPVGDEGFEEYDGYYCGTMLDRKEFALPRQGNRVVPGDFDIIFIPYGSGHTFYDRTAVWEVKVARPHSKKLNKSSKSLGTDQIKGLIADGFPLIGLMHICIPDPLEDHNLKIIPFHKMKGNPSPYPLDFEMVGMDWLPGLAIRNQMQRMITSELPKYIAMTAFALGFGPDDKSIITKSRAFNGYSSGYFNPSKKKETIDAVRKHFQEYGILRYRKIAAYTSS